MDHLPGQHYVVRLTAEDGYTAQRSYSVASAPGDPLVELFVERLDDGEVSTYLADVVEPGDELEVRGPIGGWFVWDGETPALLLAGGSGVVPFVSMLRHAKRARPGGPAAHRRLQPHPRRAALRRGAGRGRCADRAHPGGSTASARPAGWPHHELIPLWEPGQTGYVCGSASFAEAASQLLETAGRRRRPSGWSGSAPAARPPEPAPTRGREGVRRGPSSLRFPQGICARGETAMARRRAPTGPAAADRGPPRLDRRPTSASYRPRTGAGHRHRRAELAGRLSSPPGPRWAASRRRSRCRTGLGLA